MHRAEQLGRARRRSGSQPDARFVRPEKENGPGGKVRAVRFGGKDGWQLGEHVTRVMAATPLTRSNLLGLLSSGKAEWPTPKGGTLKTTNRRC
jgi:hypothetical protein